MSEPESCEQSKMRFVDAEKYVKDGVEYTVTYESSGIVSCAAPEEEVKIPELGDPDWVSYKVTFSASKSPDLKFSQIKVSPHSDLGKALVKKS
jgi:hypothetical protein